ncbi:hypothetical protein HGO38_07115 [Rhizobium sp. CG5]|uniref:hypothetical protein n=1 Tax=Rhizobium sp. CG5 TaxID=2726076 RepID=UPI0020342DBF|nr:hypothetical protein [Rhizobium sp. CG5]MCM2473247.1 hypothetical protein [Rhizobium sp. CG5]
MDKIGTGNEGDMAERGSQAVDYDTNSAAFSEAADPATRGRAALHEILMGFALVLCSPRQLQVTRQAISQADSTPDGPLLLHGDWEQKAHDAVVHVLALNPEIMPGPVRDASSIATALIGAATGGLQIAALIGHTDPDKVLQTLDERIADALTLVLGPDRSEVVVPMTRSRAF